MTGPTTTPTTTPTPATATPATATPTTPTAPAAPAVGGRGWRVHLGVLLLGIQVALFAVIGGGLTALHYRASHVEVTRALEEGFRGMRDVAARLVTERLDWSTDAVERLVEDRALVALAAAEQWPAVAARLYDRLVDLGESEADFLLVVDRDGVYRGSAGAGLSFGPELAAAFRPDLNTRRWRLTDGPRTTLVRSLPLIEPEWGRVVGHVLYGWVLTGNLTLTHGLRRTLGVPRLALYAQDRLQAAAPRDAHLSPEVEALSMATCPRDRLLTLGRGQIGYRTDLPVSDRESLTLLLLTDSEAFVGLQRAFVRNMGIGLALIAMALLATLAILRGMVVRPARWMADYARSVAQGGQTHLPPDPPPHPSRIIEFATMEQTVHRAFVDLTDVNRTLETAVVERTQALDRSDARVRLILETVVDGLFLLDSRGSITRTNPAVQGLFGHDPADLVGRDIAVILPSLRLPRLQAGGVPCRDRQPDDLPAPGHCGAAAAEPCWCLRAAVGETREMEARHRSGRSLPVEGLVNEAWIDGRPVLAVLVRGIGARKAGEEALCEARREAEEANTAKALFLANMSHELRTPLNAILGFTELAQMHDGLPPAVARHLAIVHESASSLLQVIDDILDISKLESGRMDLDIACFHLENTLGQVLKTLSPLAQDKRLTMRLDMAPGLPRCYAGDARRLRQILYNLVGNAIKFTVAGGVTVRVLATERRDKLLIEVEDTGIGIPVDRQDSIFDSFTQAREGLARPFGGSGLGTTISRRLVDLMGGRIWLDSQLGRGTTVRFTVQFAAPSCLDGCVEEGRTIPHPIPHDARPASSSLPASPSPSSDATP